VTFNIEGIAAGEVQRKLLEMGINVSVSLEESGRLDLAERKIPQLVRASVHYYNSEEEIERFCDAVAQLRLKDL
jgi:selenocysteine lyase/cysteine desulfurase